MIWRGLAGAAGLVAAVGPAHSEDAYALPPVGAQLTYRLIATTTAGGQSITTGQIYTYTMISVSGPNSEATIRPEGLIYGCAADDSRQDCVSAGRFVGAKRDGDLLTLPIPDAVADRLVEQSRYKGRYFLVEERIFPMPGPKEVDDPNSSEFGDVPIFVMANRLNCDYGPFKTFFPLGTTQKVTLTCRNVVSRSQSRITGVGNFSHEEPMTVALSYAGADTQNLPSGKWEAQKIAVRFVPDDASHPSSDGEYEVSTKLGLVIRAHTVLANEKMKFRTESTSEMIAYKP